MVTLLNCDLLYHTAFLSLPENWGGGVVDVIA